MKIKQYETDTGVVPYEVFEYDEFLNLDPLTDESLNELGFSIANGENDDGTWFTWWFVIVSGIMLTSQCSDEREGEDYYVEISEDNLIPSLKEGNPKYTTVGRVKMLIDVLKGEKHGN